MDKFLKKIAKWIVRSALYLYFKVVYRAKIIGKNNIPKNEPLILCANHKSFIEPPLIVATSGVDARFLAKEELTKNRFLAFLGVVFDAIYVKRDEKDIVALKTALKTLKQNGSVALFPEGTRNGLERGEKVKDGAAFFTLRTGAKVIPIGISGGEKPFKQVIIKYGEPIDFKEYDAKNDTEKVTEEIMNKIIELTK